MRNEAKQSPSAERPFFSSAVELAHYLGVDPVTVRRLMKRRALPFIRVGGKVLFRKLEVEAYLARRTVKATGCYRAEA